VLIAAASASKVPDPKPLNNVAVIIVKLGWPARHAEWRSFSMKTWNHRPFGKILKISPNGRVVPLTAPPGPRPGRAEQRDLTRIS
jgi:hypothetical protein